MLPPGHCFFAVQLVTILWNWCAWILIPTFIWKSAWSFLSKCPAASVRLTLHSSILRFNKLPLKGTLALLHGDSCHLPLQPKAGTILHFFPYKRNDVTSMPTSPSLLSFSPGSLAMTTSDLRFCQHYKKLCLAHWRILCFQHLGVSGKYKFTKMKRVHCYSC